MPADLDIGQVLIIAIAMIAAFVQWVWKLIQENKAARERARPQSRETPGLNVEPEVFQKPLAPAPRDGVWDLVETFKEEMRKAQAGLEPKKPQRPQLPPPERRRMAAPPAPPPLPPSPAKKAVPITPEVVTPKPIPAFAATATSRDDAVVLRMNLMNLDALKQAIILKEILGRPKGLQSPLDSF